MNRGFILLASQRTGSTLVWRTLDQHPEVSALGELFLRESEDAGSYADIARQSAFSRLSSRVAPARFAGRYLDRALTPADGIRSAGFKLMYSQVPPGFWEWSARRKPAFIHLQRRNLLKVLISKAAAETSGVRHRKAHESHAFGKVTLPTDDLAGRLTRLQADVRAHEHRLEAHRSHAAYYEDLLDNPEDFFAELFAFLGASEWKLPNLPLRKLVPDGLDEAVENASEVRGLLADTPFSAWAR